MGPIQHGRAVTCPQPSWGVTHKVEPGPGLGFESVSSFSVQTSQDTMPLLTLVLMCPTICSIYCFIIFYLLKLLSFTVIGLLGDGYFCGYKCIHSISITKSHEVSVNNDGLGGSGGHSSYGFYLHRPWDP